MYERGSSILYICFCCQCCSKIFCFWQNHFRYHACEVDGLKFEFDFSLCIPVLVEMFSCYMIWATGIGYLKSTSCYPNFLLAIINFSRRDIRKKLKIHCFRASCFIFIFNHSIFFVLYLMHILYSDFCLSFFLICPVLLNKYNSCLPIQNHGCNGQCIPVSCAWLVFC